MSARPSATGTLPDAKLAVAKEPPVQRIGLAAIDASSGDTPLPSGRHVGKCSAGLGTAFPHTTAPAEASSRTPTHVMSNRSLPMGMETPASAVGGDRLWRQAMRQIEDLRGDLAKLREEKDAIWDCLEAQGVVTGEQFSSRLHKLRFQRFLQTHPCSWEASLHSVVSMTELSVSVAKFAGMQAISQLGTASEAFSEMAGRIMCDVETIFPPRVFVLGGFDGTQALNTAEVLTLQGSKWSMLPPMKERRSGVAAATFHGGVYAVGGFNGRQRLSTMERYVPDVGGWEECPPMNSERSGAAAVVAYGKLYMIGGNSLTQVLNSAECFCPDTNSWEELPPMQTRRGAATAAVMSGKVYTVGGFDGTSFLESAECFNPESVAWESLPPMTCKRAGAAATILHGCLFAIGGFDGVEPLSSVERYDPLSETWETVQPMHMRRDAAAAVVVDGKIHVIGGDDGMRVLATVERYDPVLDKWEILPPMQVARSGTSSAACRF